MQKKTRPIREAQPVLGKDNSASLKFFPLIYRFNTVPTCVHACQPPKEMQAVTKNRNHLFEQRVSITGADIQVAT